MRQKIIAGNWKMHGQKTSINALIETLLTALSTMPLTADILVFPPSLYLPFVQALIEGSPIQLGAQNVHPQRFGAYTGEISCPMLKEFGCRYVLVGHSERRTLFGESEKFIMEKFHIVKEHDMIPVLCVGETLEQRENGQTTAVLTAQIRPFLSKGTQSFHRAVIAYEPVWAIGTGLTPSPAEVQAVHRLIRRTIAEYDEQMADRVPILYGGSLNEKNAAVFFALPDVDGGLIGGASLDAHKFLEMIACIN